MKGYKVNLRLTPTCREHHADGQHGESGNSVWIVNQKSVCQLSKKLYVSNYVSLREKKISRDDFDIP